MKIVSLFSGCGGLDLGFTKSGFETIFANDNSQSVWETYEKNHNVIIDHRSLFDISSDEIPDADGIIGGPPCQSWSLAGAMRGAKDKRGQLFFEYIRIINDKKPKFFVAENVPGILSKTHINEFNKIILKFEELGYNVQYKKLLAKDYGICQERTRVIIIGYRKDLNLNFKFPKPTHSKNGGNNTKKWLILEDVIGDLANNAKAAIEKNHHNPELEISNHEFMVGGFSSMYMSRNRKKNWNQQSFTIQAGGRHAPLHPNSSEMCKLGPDEWQFKNKNPYVRRLSVRECARIQTFPDDFKFYYDRVANGYKMVGNAVPFKLAEIIARKIKEDLTKPFSFEKAITKKKNSGLITDFFS